MKKSGFVKKWWIFIGIVILVVLLIIIALFLFVNLNQNINKCKTEQNYFYLRTSCFNDLSVQKKDISICYEITNFLKEAESKRHIDIGTESLNDTFSIELCKQNWYEKVPRNKGDISLCNQAIEPFKSICIISIAKNLKDITICNYLDKSALNWEGFIYNCYLDVAVIKSDSNICDSSPVSNEKFKENCYYAIAQKTLNEKFCDRVSEEGFGAGSNKDDCLYGVARDKKDLDICNNIINPDKKIACIATINKDIKLCETSNFKGLCEYDINSRK